MTDVKGRSSYTLKMNQEIKEEEGRVDEKPTIRHEDEQQVDLKEDAGLVEAMGILNTIPESGPVSMSPHQSTPPNIPKLQKTLKPVPKLKPLPLLISIIPAQEFDLAQAHAQMKTHRCDVCSVYFGKAEGLARHVRRTHGGAPFTCQYCSKNISRRDHLKRHIKNVHPEICTDTEIEPFRADHNASRAAKALHAENFIAQYGVPAAALSPMNLSNDGQNISLFPQPEQQYVQVQDDLYDEEFEGEDPEASDEGLQQITLEHDLPWPDDFDAFSESETYREDNSDKQHLIVQNPALSSNQVPADAPIKLEQKYKCDKCDAAFISKINLERHINTHSIIRPHKCALCGKGFLRKEHLTIHLRSVHYGMKFTCQFCGKDISRKGHLRRHIRSLHPVECMGIPAECSQSEMTEMSQPVPRHGENSILGLQFTPIDELHEHQSSVHSHVRKYKCPKCPTAFTLKQNLVRHQVLHSDQKKFACWICRKVFRRRDAVHDHIRRVHRQAATPLSNYPCNLCDNVFQQQAHLGQHLKTYHRVSANNNPRLWA